MARRIEHRTTFTTPAAEVYAALIDPGYLGDRLAVLGGPGAAVGSHDITGDRVRFRLRHGVAAAHLPPAVRTLLGGDLTLDRTETWQPRDGGYAGTVQVTIAGVPGSLDGTTWLVDLPVGGSEHTVSARIAVPIPLVGGRIEESVTGQLNQLLDSEHDFTQRWLDDHRR